MTELLWHVILFLLPAVMLSIIAEQIEKARVLRAIRHGKLIIIQSGRQTIIGPATPEEGRK